MLMGFGKVLQRSTIQENVMQIFNSIGVSAPATNAVSPKDLFLGKFDSLSDELLKFTTSTTMPKVLVRVREQLVGGIIPKIEIDGVDRQAFLGDLCYLIEKTAVEIQQQAMLPSDFSLPVTFAYDCKRGDGGRGSVERPHFRERSQIRKYSGRLMIIARVKSWQAEVYLAVCDYLGIAKPEELNIDPDLVTMTEQLRV